MKKYVSFLVAISLIITISIPVFTQAADSSVGGTGIGVQLSATMSYLTTSVPAPSFGMGGGEWTVMALARAGHHVPDEYFENYYKKIEKVLKDGNGILPDSEKKKTEYSRLIIALTSIGKDVTDIAGYDLTAWLSSMSKVTRQGINGAIYALIALDTKNYDIPDITSAASVTGYTADTSDQASRQKLVSYILERELGKGTENAGGFSLLPGEPDPDTTAAAIQALAPYCSMADVSAAVERAVNVLSDIQLPDGTYSSWGSVNSESIAQVIIALTALRIDPVHDNRFNKEGNNPLSALLELYVEGGGFRHIPNTGLNAIATDQAACALAAYARYCDGANSLYEMSDAPDGWRFDDSNDIDNTTGVTNSNTQQTTENTTKTNETTKNTTIQQGTSGISSQKYIIDGGFIKNISEHTALETFLFNINESGVSVFLNDGDTALIAGMPVGTGMLVKLIYGDSVIQECFAVVKGDIDGNGLITAADARLALRCSASLVTLTGAFLTAADINGDGDIKASNARKILRYSAQLEDTL